MHAAAIEKYKRYALPSLPLSIALHGGKLIGVTEEERVEHATLPCGKFEKVDFRHDFYTLFSDTPRTNGCEFAHEPKGQKPKNRRIRMLGLSNSMAAEAEVQFLSRT